MTVTQSSSPNETSITSQEAGVNLVGSAVVRNQQGIIAARLESPELSAEPPA